MSDHEFYTKLSRCFGWLAATSAALLAILAVAFTAGWLPLLPTTGFGLGGLAVLVVFQAVCWSHLRDRVRGEPR